MLASVRALLAGVVDYAGLFPPAQLPMDAAIGNYARYRQEPESWMLGRFICPAARLGELAAYRDNLFAEGPPFAFSILGRGGSNCHEFLSGLRADANDIAAFCAYHGPRIQVEAYEVRLPADVKGIDLFEQTADLLGDSARGFQAGDEPGWIGYYEIPLGIDMRENLIRTCRLALTYNLAEGIKRPHALRPAGIKLRSGGVEAAAFPAPRLVADAILCCRDSRQRLKFTAGLHHPVRHFDSGLGTRMHGFLNVFGAGVLAHARRVSNQQVLSIIEDEDPASFVFDEQGFGWQGHKATTKEIAAGRRKLVTSFGSCSFDEPRSDLGGMGLLD